VIVAVDGVDVTGASAGLYSSQTLAPAGTKIALTTQRGPTATITLAAP